MPKSHKNYKGNSALPSQKGFTLIEMSIVLVLIALIATGIIGGQSIINSAKLAGILSDITKYQAAYNTFKLQFKALPGDIRNGYDYFGGTEGNTICGNDEHYPHSGCNGDGDGKMETGEGVRAWHHLKAADILDLNIAAYQDGMYSFPSPGNIATDSVFHNNVPLAKHRYNDFTGYMFGGYDYYEPDEENWFGKTGAWLIYGAGLTSWWIAEAGAISPKNASSIDTKADDGLPGTGKITAINGSEAAEVNNEITPGCALNGMVYFTRDASESSRANATYNLGADTVSCVLHFYLEND